MKFLSTYSLFESNSFFNNSKLVLKLFRENILRRENIDLIHKVTGIKLTQDMEVIKDKSYSASAIRFINSGSGQYVSCSVDITRRYDKQDYIGICEYLNELDNNDEDAGYVNIYGSSLKNSIDITLKCGKNRKISCVFKIGFDKMTLLDIDEKFSCPFNTNSGEFIKYIKQFMDDINGRIDDLMPSIIHKSEEIQDGLYKKLALLIEKNPRYTEEIKNYTRVWNRLNNISNNGVSDTNDMLDVGFFD